MACNNSLIRQEYFWPLTKIAVAVSLHSDHIEGSPNLLGHVVASVQWTQYMLCSDGGIIAVVIWCRKAKFLALCLHSGHSSMTA